MSQTNKRILIVDDEVDILELLQYNLEKEGYQVKVATNSADALKIAGNFLPELILLDIMMPGTDGVETCRQIREINQLNSCFVIFLTARSEEYSEVAAFDAGADDFINKPIKTRALISRIAALFRREEKKTDLSQYIDYESIQIDRVSYTVTINGTHIVLPKKEFELLYFLAKNPSKVYNREELLQNIWGSDVYVLSRTVDVHVRKVREKIGEDFIKTVKGVGYKFDPKS